MIKRYNEHQIKKDLHLILKIREYEIFFSLYNAMKDYDLPEIPKIKKESDWLRNKREKKEMKNRFKHEERLSKERTLVQEWKKRRDEKKEMNKIIGGKIL
jgi:hypothetical protein